MNKKFKTNNKIDINFQVINNAINFKILNNLIKNILNILKLENKEISFLFCNNNQIQKLNKKFCNKNYPTDVLSFQEGKYFSKRRFLGDIAISIEQAKKQSLKYGHSFLDEVLKLLIHGILHLLGYDHEIGIEEEKKMINLEKNIFLEVKRISLC